MPDKKVDPILRAKFPIPTPMPAKTPPAVIPPAEPVLPECIAFDTAKQKAAKK